MPIDITDFRWPRGVEEKIEVKHGLKPDDVEDAFYHGEALVRRGRGVHYLYSRTPGGAYLFVAFVRDRHSATIVTAREMTMTERRLYNRR